MENVKTTLADGCHETEMVSIKSFKVWKGNKAIKLFIFIKIIQFIYMRPAFELKSKGKTSHLCWSHGVKLKLKDLWIMLILVKAKSKSCLPKGFEDAAGSF